MLKIALWGVAIAVAALMGTVVPSLARNAGQNSDPANVMRIFQTALNSGDANGASIDFADDAVVSATTSKSTFSGKQAIGAWLQYLVSQHALFPMSNIQAVGEVVLESSPLTLDVWTQLGVGPLDNIAQAVVRSGKIESLVISLTPDAQTKFDAALAKLPAADAPSIIGAVIDLINAKKMDAALALFSDSAVVTTVPPSPGQSGVYSGKKAIQGWLQGLAAQNIHIEHGLALATGADSALSFDRLSGDPFKHLGLDALDQVAQVVVQNSQIKSLTTSFTSASLAKLMAAASSAPAPK
ncbi:MAG: hypothetical protein ACYDBJ_12130 [Aggregatilineales bacterium]